ncbi:RIP metalloprotease RseP [Candidatus Parcubacteria bacterium]|nr:MAG: RIP metalloprotease RseP [Candidatus Parcubacteria bacterium]
MFTVIIFLAVLSVLVLAHELGHFLTARRYGAKAEEFGLGFPPRAVGVYKSTDGSWKKVFGSREVEDAADTVYSLNWLPLGGFVKIKGEDGESEDPDSFVSKKMWQKAVILVAGVTMNIILAFVLISFGYMIGFPQTIDNNSEGKVIDQQIQVVDLLEGSAADLAGVKPGDVVTGIDGIDFENFEALQNYVNENVGNEITYEVRRGYEEMEFVLIPEVREETNRGGVGVSIVETGTVKYSFFRAIWEGMKTTVVITWMIFLAFLGLIRDLVMGSGVSADVAGPVGIAVITGQAARLGFAHLLQFTALLSINLAIINILPIPALDGGRLLFLAIEKIKGKPMKKETEALVHNIGFLLLMLLILVVTFKEVSKFGGAITGLFSKIIN